MPRKMSICSIPMNLRAIIKKGSLLGILGSQCRGQRWAYRQSQCRVWGPSILAGLASFLSSHLWGELNDSDPTAPISLRKHLRMLSGYPTVSITVVIIFMPQFSLQSAVWLHPLYVIETSSHKVLQPMAFSFPLFLHLLCGVLFFCA